MKRNRVDLLEKFNSFEPIVLSNPWFGVGGLERVYLAITSIKKDARIVSVKNYHDTKSFQYYFGSHRKMPVVEDINLMVEWENPLVYICMNEALKKYFLTHDHVHFAHVSNHWGVFQPHEHDSKKKVLYFQPGVLELENIAKNHVLNRLYEENLPDYQILSNSRYIQEFLKKEFGVKSKVLYPCTDTEFFKVKDDLALDESFIQKKKHDVMIFSRLNPGKRFTEAMSIFEKIMERHPESRFLVAGAIKKEDEHFLTKLKQIARDFNLQDKVDFVPNPSLETLKILYQDSKLLLFLPKNEPLGLVPIEATCSLVPVIGFNEGGIKETVIDGKTGFLCKDEWEIVDKVSYLLEHPEKIKTFRDNSVDVIKKFSEFSFLDNFLDLIS
ncbi:MAG: glycosyltransferase family 4 protein [Promethearchaeota archaeon]